jgi:maltose O-acetyltransferase
LHLDSGTHDPETLEPKLLPIKIGNRVWCGINVTVIASVSIGDDVVIGAGSVVCKDIPSNSIAVGVPAKVVKPLNRQSDSLIWTWVKKNKSVD